MNLLRSACEWHSLTCVIVVLQHPLNKFNWVNLNWSDNELVTTVENKMLKSAHFMIEEKFRRQKIERRTARKT